MRRERLRRRLFPKPLSLFQGQNPGEAIAGDISFAGREQFLALILLGPPGSGKGTQAALLGEELALPHISTGAILRDRILVGDAFGKAVAERIDVGQFVPDDWINRILDERMAMADCRSGLILDGYPRTLPQAERLVEHVRNFDGKTIVVRLDARPETLVQRFSGRRQCSACGALFHLRYQPSLAGEVCDRPGCAGVLVERQDDRPEFVSGRLADFDRLTAPVMSYLEPRVTGIVHVDAGAGSPDEVLEQIFSGLEALPALSRSSVEPHESAGIVERHCGTLASSGGRD